MKYLQKFKLAKKLIDEADSLMLDKSILNNAAKFNRLLKIRNELYSIQLEIFEDEINDRDFKVNLFMVDILTSIKLIIFRFDLIERKYND